MTDWILSLEKPLMIFFQSVRLPLLSKLGEIITILGETTVATALVFFIYFCVDKKAGYAASLVTMSAHVVTNTVKIILRIPRPWVKYPEEIVPLRKSTATGYSFPSGHSTNAGAVYGSVMRLYGKRKGIRVLCILLFILIPLSRLYLGVHWPLDVAAGLLIGMAASSFLERFISLYDNRDLFRKAVIIIVPVFYILAIADAVLIDTKVLDKVLYKDISDTFTALSALLLSGYIESEHVAFRNQKTLVGRLLCFFAGFLSAYALTLFWTARISSFHCLIKVFSLSFMIFYLMVLYPLLLIRLGLMEKEEN